MTKKNRKTEDEEPAEIESAEDNADLSETASANREAEAASSAPESESRDVNQAPESEASDEPSMDDLLDDVRRSLIEDEAQSAEKKPGWLKRIKKGRRKDQPVAESPVDREVESIPAVTDVPVEPPKDSQYLDEIDELIGMLETETSTEESKPEPSPALAPGASVDHAQDKPVQAAEVAPPPEPEAPVDVEELKKRVFSPREGVEEQDISKVREVALGDGEGVFVEVEAKQADAAQDRMKAFENSLRPYRQYIYFAVAFLGVVLAVLAIGIMYTAYQRTRPPEPTPIASNLPHPVAMALPGGLNFNLGRGSIKDGKWNPSGPEWLEGTEICRWVAIPWSKQLEAVVRTLTQDDSIELVMSNNDRLKYQVYSREEMTLAEMQALDQNSPCLLLVLAKQDADKRWVVTAKP